MEFKLILRPEEGEHFQALFNETTAIDKKIDLLDSKNLEAINKHFGALKDYLDLSRTHHLTMSNNLNQEFEIENNNDLIPALMIIDAVLCVENSKGKEIISLDEYFSRTSSKTNYKISEIRAGERKGKSGYSVFFNEETDDKYSAAAYLEIENNKVKRFKAAIGGNYINSFRLYEIENIVVGKNVEYLFNDKIQRILLKKLYKTAKMNNKVIVNSKEISAIYMEAINNALRRME